jgi:hypothetical protein
VRAARQIPQVEAAAREQTARRGHVPRLSPVRGAQERNLSVAESEALGASPLEERQGLERLGRRPYEDRLAGITGPGQKIARLFHHGEGATVDGLDALAAKNPRKDRRGPPHGGLI